MTARNSFIRSHVPFLSLSTCLFTSLFIGACTDDGSSEDDEATETGDTDTETGTDTDTGEEALAIIGDYTDEWGDNHSITAETWTNSAGVFHIEQWDNAATYLVAQNDAGNEFNPELWSRFDWTWDADEVLYYCQSVYDGASIDAALAGSADTADLAAGCGGFAWTKMQ